MEKTKVTLESKDCFYILQGNTAFDVEYLHSAAESLISLTRCFVVGKPRFCMMVKYDYVKKFCL